jgi:uncharacterized protein (DUF433 family)
MSDDFEKMLARLDSHDELTRESALHELERLFREQHPPRVDESTLPAAQKSPRRKRGGDKEGRVLPPEEPNSSVENASLSSEEAQASEERYETARQAALRAMQNAQPRGVAPSREEIQRHSGLWSRGPGKFEFDADRGRTFLGPSSAHRTGAPAPQMQPEKLAEIAARHLGELPDDLSDRATALYLDAIDDVRDLVAEVVRFHASAGQDVAADFASSDSDDRDADDSLPSTNAPVRAVRFGKEIERIAGLSTRKRRVAPQFLGDPGRDFLGDVARPFLRRKERQGDTTPPLAVAAGVRKRRLWVFLRDGRIVSVPLAWFPRLANAKAKQRRHVVIEEAGHALHWPELDEDLGVEPLLTHVPVTLAAEKTSRGNRPSIHSKKWRRTQRRRSRRAWEEFALAEGKPDPIETHRIPAQALRMRDQGQSEIQERQLGPLPDDLSDRVVALSPDAINHIHHLASEVERLRGAVGQQTTTDPGVTSPDEPDPADSGRSSVSSAWRQRITADSSIRSGQPTLRGMRITVKDVLGLLAAGMTPDEILSEYPHVERQDILAALEYAAETVPDKIPE